MPRKPKVSSPIRELRLALQKTQKEFAHLLASSTPYVQAIELGQRPIPERFCDVIELEFGVRAGSLKQKQGLPVVWLFQEKTVVGMPQEIGEPILKKLRELRAKPRERLRYQIKLWKQMRPRMEDLAPRDDMLHKLDLFLAAAAAERKQLAALFQLDRWIEDQIASLKLCKAIEAQKIG
jgi:transcriptional regulator with XRE-family HTH domain